VSFWPRPLALSVSLSLCLSVSVSLPLCVSPSLCFSLSVFLSLCVSLSSLSKSEKGRRQSAPCSSLSVSANRIPLVRAEGPKTAQWQNGPYIRPDLNRVGAIVLLCLLKSPPIWRLFCHCPVFGLSPRISSANSSYQWEECKASFLTPSKCTVHGDGQAFR
jgi:hypothetical protein